MLHVTLAHDRFPNPKKLIDRILLLGKQYAKRGIREFLIKSEEMQQCQQTVSVTLLNEVAPLLGGSRPLSIKILEFCDFCLSE
jgi:hypothetical protein